MTRPANLPLYGKVGFRKVRKERLLDLWAKVVNEQRLADQLWRARRARRAPRRAASWSSTSHNRYQARAVLLANGRRGSPRKLGVPGEEAAKVVYRLTDPSQYRGSQVLVVGGGDSALEAAAMLATEPGVAVTLAHRGAAFPRGKPQSRRRVEAAVRAAAPAGADGLRDRGHPRRLRRRRLAGPPHAHRQPRRHRVRRRRAARRLPHGMGIEVETKYGTA